MESKKVVESSEVGDANFVANIHIILDGVDISSACYKAEVYEDGTGTAWCYKQPLRMNPENTDVAREVLTGKVQIVRPANGKPMGMEKDWRCDPKQSGGGELIDQGVHLIDLARSGKGTVLTLAQAREMLAAGRCMTTNERALLVILTDLETRFNNLVEAVEYKHKASAEGSMTPIFERVEMAAVTPRQAQVLKRLEELIPLFKSFHPEGWRDFRDLELTKTWRGGLYVKTAGNDGHMEIKALFGSKAPAVLAAHLFHTATDCSAIAEQPKYSLIWQVRMSFSEDGVCW